MSSMIKELRHAIFFEVEIHNLALEIVKRGKLVQNEVVVASHISTVYLTRILKMNRMDSVKGQASRRDERHS